MKIYLAGNITNNELQDMKEKGNKYLLQTFYEMRKWRMKRWKNIFQAVRSFFWIQAHLRL